MEGEAANTQDGMARTRGKDSNHSRKQLRQKGFGREESKDLCGQRTNSGQDAMHWMTSNLTNIIEIVRG